MANVTARREMVVLVHGLWMKGWCLALLAWRLQRAGFETRCFSYRSMGADLHENAVLLQDYLAELPHETVHFVGHSLGGIVVRALFHYFPRRRPGRIVMLAPPNRGSMAAEVAFDRLGSALLGRAVKDLLGGVVRQWPLPARDVGIVSGTVSFGLGRLVVDLPTPNDGVVGVAETNFSGSKATLTLPVTHTGMIVSKMVARAVVKFLPAGEFG